MWVTCNVCGEEKWVMFEEDFIDRDGVCDECWSEWEAEYNALNDAFLKTRF